MLPSAALPAIVAAGHRVAGEPGGRDVLAHVGVGQGAGEEVHRVVHQGRLRLKRYILCTMYHCQHSKYIGFLVGPSGRIAMLGG